MNSVSLINLPIFHNFFSMLRTNNIEKKLRNKITIHSIFNKFYHKTSIKFYKDKIKNYAI